MYRAFIKKDDSVTTEEILDIYAAMIELSLLLAHNNPPKVLIRSSALAPDHANQYIHPDALLTDYALLEKLRSAEIFLMNISMWPNDSYIQIHLRGLGDRGRNIILIACYDDKAHSILKEKLSSIFPEHYIDNQEAAIAASEKLDIETWDPDMDDDGEDSALDVLNSMKK